MDIGGGLPMMIIQDCRRRNPRGESSSGSFGAAYELVSQRFIRALAGRGSAWGGDLLGSLVRSMHSELIKRTMKKRSGKVSKCTTYTNH